MRRGKANVKKSKTEEEPEIAPENEDATETQDNGENEQDSSGEANKTDAAQKRKPKRGKAQETASGDAENAESPEKRAKRVPKKAGNAAEAATGEGEEYEVEEIVDMKEIKGKRQFKIHWKGYGPENETWEMEANLNCPDLIKEFLDQLPDKKKRPATSKAGKKKAKSGLEDGNATSQTELKEYEVAEVMQMQRKKGKREFLVHWKGFSHDEDTWEPEDNLNCPELIEEFLKKAKTDNKTTKRAAASDKGRRGRQGKSKKRVAQQK